MTTYNTGNPLGSTAVKDLYDNAENFDIALNDPAVDSWTDRLGRSRKSWAGMERKFDTFLNASNAEFQQFLLSSGYQDLGDYAAGVQITSRNQIFRRDGELYRAGPGLDLPYTLTGDWATEGSNFVAVGDAALRQELSYRLPTDVLAHGAVGDGTTLNDAAFQAAEVAADVIYVPEGEFRLSTPMALGATAAYYGPGVLKFDIAEWWRAGGSAGAAPTERFTLFFHYANQSDVYCTVDDVPQELEWITPTTFSVAAPPAGTSVKYGVINGVLPLGPTPEAVFAYNAFANGGDKVAPSITTPQASTTGINNAGFGPRALQNITTASNNSAFGSRALVSSTTGGNNTAMGFQALYRNIGTGNTAVGSVAGEWNVSGNFNVFLGLQAGSKNVSGSYSTAVGQGALGESGVASYATAVGHRAMGNSGEAADISNNTCVGAFAGDFTRAQNNTFVGYRAGCGPNSGTDGHDNVAIGFFAMRNQNGADYSVAVGVGALSGATSASNNVAVGYEALAATTTVGSMVAVGYQALYANTSGTMNTAVGESSLKSNTTGTGNTAVGFATLVSSSSSENTVVGCRAGNALTTGSGLTAVGFEAGHFMTTGSNGTFVGHRAGRSSTGGDNTGFGHDALQLNTTGIQNTALGRAALRLAQDGSDQTGYSNSTGVGYQAAVSGSNQVQLGNSATTTYVYGTVQNRSDARDKADIQDTVLGLGFINALRPVDFKWDMREDYITVEEYAVDVEQEYEEPSAMLGTDGRPIMVTKTRIVQEMRERVVRRERDGSKKRNRFHHGLLSHQVKEVADRLGVDFGGYQDHTVNGGCDVQSLGYDEFIAPLIRAVQELSTENANLRSRIEALEARP